MSNEADREDFLSYRRAQRNLNASTIIGGLLIGAGLYTNKKSLPYYGGAIVSGIFGLLFQAESGIQMQKMMDDYNETKGLSSYRLDVIPGKMVISF